MQMSTKKTIDRPVVAPHDGAIEALANYPALLTMLIAAGSVILGYLLHGALPDVITAALALLVVALALPGFQSGIFARFRSSLWCMVTTLLAYLALIVSSGHPEGLKVLLQVFLAFCFFGVGLIAGERADRRPWIDQMVFWVGIGCLFSVLAVVRLVPAGIDDLPKNAMGGVGLYISVMIITARAALTRKSSTLLWLGFPMAIDGLLSGHRLALGLAPLTFIALSTSQWLQSRKLERSFVYGAAIVSFMTVWMYTNFQTLSSFDKYNRLVQDLTGRQILSGRQLIWGPILDAIAGHLWTGSGLEITASAFTGLDFSTHNAFLMILLQTGLAGFLPFCAVLFTLCWSATRGGYLPWKAYFSVALACAIVHNTYEAALIQNNFPIVMMTWLSLGYVGGRLPIFAKSRETKMRTIRRLPVTASEI